MIFHGDGQDHLVGSRSTRSSDPAAVEYHNDRKRLSSVFGIEQG
jgi:hypothetical protein